jgi:monofunctional biosynthetic peptidoglycan transglycosylase
MAAMTVFRIVAKGILWFIGLSILWVLLYALVPPPTTLTMLFDTNGATRKWMPLRQMDNNMPRAAIAAEDANFCHHHGFDFNAIEQAMNANAKGRRMRGGSTISQQTAKNVFLWQGSGVVSRSLRKLPEAWFTFLIELMWGKKRIMEMYLNVAETGIGTYGANAGAQRYFHHDASRLSRTEAARIAAILPLPKHREATDPGGFTRRYGNRIAARIGVVERDGLDNCLR